MKIMLEGRKKDGTDWTKEEVWELIQTNDKVLYGALKHLYACQTEDEKDAYTTSHSNGRGFNYYDAEFLTSICKQLLQRGTLSEKQKEYAKKKLKKYLGQLTDLANEDRKLNDNLNESSAKKSKSTLEKEIKDATHKFMVSRGFDDDDADEYSVVEISRDEDGRTKVEVRAELSYNALSRLSEILDKIVAKYDSDAYFDMEDSGIINAYLETNLNESAEQEVYKMMSKSVDALDSIEKKDKKKANDDIDKAIKSGEDAKSELKESRYSDDDYYEQEVHADDEFIENGVTYYFVEPVGDKVYLDFDCWQAWYCIREGGDEAWCVVDPDTSFVDWICDSEDEAIEFLNGKVDDYNDLDESVKKSHKCRNCGKKIPATEELCESCKSSLTEAICGKEKEVIKLKPGNVFVKKKSELNNSDKYLTVDKVEYNKEWDDESEDHKEEYKVFFTTEDGKKKYSLYSADDKVFCVNKKSELDASLDDDLTESINLFNSGNLTENKLHEFIDDDFEEPEDDYDEEDYSDQSFLDRDAQSDYAYGEEDWLDDEEDVAGEFDEDDDYFPDPHSMNILDFIDEMMNIGYSEDEAARIWQSENNPDYNANDYDESLDAGKLKEEFDDDNDREPSSDYSFNDFLHDIFKVKVGEEDLGTLKGSDFKPDSVITDLTNDEDNYVPSTPTVMPNPNNMSMPEYMDAMLNLGYTDDEINKMWEDAHGE